MQKKSIIAPFSIALAIAFGLAIYFFFRVDNLKDSLQLSEQKVAAADSIRSYIALGDIDSLLFEGRYADALKAYRNQLSDSNIHAISAIQQRIRHTRKLLYMQEQVQLQNQGDTLLPDTLTIERTATPEEVRQYDSLQFALSKTKVQVENLKRQLLQKSAGQYLVFTTSKGNKVHYVGKVENEKANGQGIALFETGSRYEGEWENNKRHGQGTFYWPDGEYYDGEYQADKRSGKGTYYWPNGEKFTGEWADDQRNGKGTFYGEEGDIVAQGTWEDDELVKETKDSK